MATPPKTILLLLEQISTLQSRKAVFTMLICQHEEGPGHEKGSH